MSQEQDVFPSPSGSSQAASAGSDSASGGESAGRAGLEPAPHPHDFEVQKQIHQQIRNDPDYDDWEYGTEPLPHEAWVPRSQGTAADAGSINGASSPA